MAVMKKGLVPLSATAVRTAEKERQEAEQAAKPPAGQPADTTAHKAALERQLAGEDARTSDVTGTFDVATNIVAAGVAELSRKLSEAGVTAAERQALFKAASGLCLAYGRLYA